MNERNVEALAEIVDAYIGENPYINQGGGSAALEKLAEFLASRGVLVPSALTDQEIELEIWFAGTSYEAASLSGEPDRATPNSAGLRASLERIAKGEAGEG